MASTPRSDCPIAYALDIFGDRWTLLVIRDLALKGKHTFKELLGAGEGIASNILSERLNRLQDAGLVEKRPHPQDRRSNIFVLTESGKDLIGVLVDLILWGAKNAPHSDVSDAFIQRAENDRQGLIRDLRDALDHL